VADGVGPVTDPELKADARKQCQGAGVGVRARAFRRSNRERAPQASSRARRRGRGGDVAEGGPAPAGGERRPRADEDAWMR